MVTSTGEYVRTCYVNRLLELPPLMAQAAYDAHTPSSTSHRWRLRSATARLDLGGPVRPYAGPGWWPLRGHFGTLTVGWYRWPVELELLPWSTDRTELGLRPGSHRARSLPPASVTDAGHELLDQLAANLQVWSEQPLHDYAWTAAEVPARTTPTTGFTA